MFCIWASLTWSNPIMTHHFLTLQDGMQQRRGSHDNQQVGVGLSSNPRSGVVYRHNLAPHHQSRPPRRGVSVPDLVINNKDFSGGDPCLKQSSSLLHWGSEYLTSLVFKWSKVVQSLNCQLFKCHLNTGLNLVWYSDHHLNTGPVFKWWSQYRTTI